MAQTSWVAGQLETANSRAEFDAAAAANGIDFAALINAEIKRAFVVRCEFVSFRWFDHLFHLLTILLSATPHPCHHLLTSITHAR
jgi:hypothetical protein